MLHTNIGNYNPFIGILNTILGKTNLFWVALHTNIGIQNITLKSDNPWWEVAGPIMGIIVHIGICIKIPIMGIFQFGFY